jgi:ribonuclease HI
MMHYADIWVDGSCIPNPGPGGWAAILRSGPHAKEISGKVPENTTNQRMELLATIRALEALKKPCRVRLHSDSNYLIKTMRQEFRRGANMDLWEWIEKVAAPHEIEWIKVPAHEGLNNRAHALAGASESGAES